MRLSLPFLLLLAAGVPAAAVTAASMAAPTASAPGPSRAVSFPVRTELSDGDALLEELGCAACHTGVGDAALIRSRAPALGRAASAPLAAEFIFTYLERPTSRRTDIGRSRMPDFGLDEGERLALALFLGAPASRADALAPVQSRHPGVDASLGGRIYAALGCGGCHGAAEPSRPFPDVHVGPDLSKEGARVLPSWLADYVRAPRPIRRPGDPTAPGARMPRFGLSDAEAAAITDALARRGLPPGRAGSRPDTLPALTPYQAARMRTLLAKRVACLGCHTVDGEGGRIGPGLEDIAARLRPSFVAQMIESPREAAPGALMPRQDLPPGAARRLARYLLDRSRIAGGGEGSHLAPASSSLATPASPSLADPAHPAWSGATGRRAAEDEGSRLYARHCAACHGASGWADGWNAPYLPVAPTAHADSTLMARRADDTLFDGIYAGAWVLDGSNRMPAFGNLLAPAEIRALIRRIRDLCRCSTPAWSKPPKGGGQSGGARGLTPAPNEGPTPSPNEGPTPSPNEAQPPLDGEPLW